MKKIRDQNFQLLRTGETGSVHGGNLWPFFDIQKILSGIMYGEDLFFKDLLKK